MLQRFNMPTHTIPMLSKKPKAATADLHKDLLGTRNPGLGYIAKRAQPVLYDADTLLHPAHHPVRIWDSEDVLVHQVKELSQEQAYWLSANEIASNASNPATPVTPFVHNRPPPSQVLFHFQQVNAVFHQFEDFDVLDAEYLALLETTKVLNLKLSFKATKMVIESEEKSFQREGSCDQQALETDRIQLKDTITSLRIQLDGLKLSALTSENTKLKALVHGKTSSGPSTSEKPKVLASGMIMEPIVEPLELTPSVSSSSKVTMISRFTDCKLSDRKAGSKGLSGELLALESWAGQTDAQRAALWHGISDTHMENRELRLQIAEERRARLDLAEIIDSMRRGQEPRGDV
ncbi:hypothetical protein Tco_1483696 [Tanacetum coccineum]